MDVFDIPWCFSKFKPGDEVHVADREPSETASYRVVKNLPGGYCRVAVSTFWFGEGRKTTEEIFHESELEAA